MGITDIVILNWNGEQHLRTFLPSVVANSPAGVRITVADNGSTDGSRELLKREFPDVNLIEMDRNYGYAEGYNRALTEGSFDGTGYFVLLNSDVETPPGWLEPLTEYLDDHPRTAAVAPKILSFENKSTFEYAGASGGFIDALGYPFCRGRILTTLEQDTGQYDDAREVFWATGACMAVRKDVFHELGGFDPGFFAHMEEIDLCWRMQLAGWKIAVQPRSHVYHLGGGTLQSGSPRKLYLNYRNTLYMLYKNLPPGRRGMAIALRMMADGLSALVYLLTFRAGAFRAVWTAHRDFRSTRKKYGHLPPVTVPLKKLSGVYHGSIVARYLFGKRKFGRML
ncbi:MAG: glycosyltransferase family 2 protein [Alistipes sp.]|nr:glycosyltransferase family 2 protein [Alistipes sp.]